MPDLDEILPLPTPMPAVTDFLLQRRSNMAKLMEGPGPDADTLSTILTIAARVPDHRKLSPWRFIIFEGKARSSLGAHIGAVFGEQNPDLPLDRTVFESARLMRAPTVVAVISSPKTCVRGTPEWEQVLSAGAVCYNMVIGAQSLGFGAQWLTEWFSYDPTITGKMGLTAEEKVAGFIYMGQASAPSRERVRPSVADITSHYI